MQCVLLILPITDDHKINETMTIYILFSIVNSTEEFTSLDGNRVLLSIEQHIKLKHSEPMALNW